MYHLHNPTLNLISGVKRKSEINTYFLQQLCHFCLFLWVYYLFYIDSYFTDRTLECCTSQVKAVPGGLQSKFTMSEKPYGAGYVIQASKCISTMMTGKQKRKSLIICPMIRICHKGCWCFTATSVAGNWQNVGRSMIFPMSLHWIFLNLWIQDLCRIPEISGN